MRRGVSAPNLNQLERYGTSREGMKEVVWNPLYDFQTYLAAGQLQTTFFSTPIGGTKTKADTNMNLAGQIAAGKSFLLTGIQCVFFPGSSPGRAGIAPASLTASQWNDVYAVLKAGWLELLIGDKTYAIDAPLMKFPPVFRLAGTSSLADSTTAGAAQGTIIDYASSAGAAYQVTPLKIPSNQNFSVTANFAALVPTPSTVAGRIGVILDGFLYRDSQ